jgi:S1-C subfamily serine protease
MGGDRRFSSIVRYGVPLVAAGAIGAGVALGIVAAVDGDGATTVIQQAAAPETAQRELAQLEPAQLEPAEGNLGVQEIYRRSAPGVVQILAVTEGGSGSGFVIDKSGHIVTNFHVVQGSSEPEIIFSDRDPVRATVVGVDPSTDIAVLEVDLPAGALRPLPLGDSDGVQVGDPVVAIGNPFGLERTVTAGIVSALQREITAPNGFLIDQVIQTDAQINRGNSGGPLLNARAEVIGVTSQIETGGGAGNVGIGFAVPIDTVREVASQLIESGKVEHAFLGIEMQTITAELAENFRLPAEEGILIASVRPGSPAEEAGLRGGDTTVVVDGQNWVLGGDLITKADGEAITEAGELRDAVLSKKPGDTITLEVKRDGETLTISVELGRQPTTPTG